jgi:L-malate glycosyltransferase
MTLRILYIGHAYVVAENQKKIAALAAQPDVDVLLVTPHLWREPVLKKIRAHVPISAQYQVKPIRAMWPGVEQYHWYLSADLEMRRFKPHVICVEQGAGSFVYAQTLLYRNRYAPRTKAVFFTWWNLPYHARWPLREVERFNLSETQGAVAGNQDAANILRDHSYGGPLTVLPQLGVDTDEYRPIDAAGLCQQLGLTEFTVGYVGRFVEEKGIRVLLQALAGVSFNFQLLMLGRGPLEQEIREFAQEHGWGDKLKIISGVGHSEMARYQNAMDVMVVPSLTRPFWKEQFGHVLVEAMACGVPVIGSDSAEVPNVLGDAGIVTPEGDVAALQTALERVAASSELRAELGHAGRERVLHHFTNESIVQKLLNFFGEIPQRQ